MKSTKQIIVNHLSPIQTGIWIPNGTEKIINHVSTSLQLDNTLHTLRQCIQQHRTHTHTSFLQNNITERIPFYVIADVAKNITIDVNYRQQGLVVTMSIRNRWNRN